MGFLDKFKKSNDNQEEKKEPTSRMKSTGVFGGSKVKADGIIGAMGLAESVPEAALAEFEEAVEYNDGLVAEFDRGYTVILMNNLDLEEIGVDVKSEDFGSLANDIKENNIQAVVLPVDLSVGVLPLIPTEDTIEALREYSILDDYTYNIGTLPKDLNEESEVHMYETEYTIERLYTSMQAGYIFHEIDDDNVELGNPLDFGREDKATEEQWKESETQDLINDVSGPDDNESGDFINDEDLNTHNHFNVDESAYEPVSGSSDTSFNEGNDLDDIFEDDDEFLSDSDDLDLSFEDDGFDVNNEDIDGYSFDSDDSTHSDLSVDNEFDVESFDDDTFARFNEEPPLPPISSGNKRGLTALESAQELIKVTNRAFSNDELGLTMRGEAFNNQIADFEPVLFDEYIEVDGELDKVAQRMRQDANTAIISHHNSEVQKLRTLYTTGLSNVHDRLGDDLDYQNSDTVFGKQWDETIKRHQDEMIDMDVVRRDTRQELLGEYETNREDFGDSAKEAAMHEYDRAHEGWVENELNAYMNRYKEDVDLTKKNRQAEILELRQKTAKRIYDKAVTKLLMDIQKRFETLMEEEKQLYTKHKNKLNKYYRDHYTDEVLRKKALEEELRQTHKADSVRAEYEQMLSAKTQELQEAQERSDRQLRDLANTKDAELSDLINRHRDELDSLRSRHNEAIAEKDSHIATLKDDQEDLFRKVETVRRDMREEYDANTRALKGKLNLAESKLEAHKEKLDEFSVRQSTEDYHKAIIAGATGVIALAIGLFAGWILFGTQPDNSPTFINQNGQPVEVIDVKELDDKSDQSTDESTDEKAVEGQPEESAEEQAAEQVEKQNEGQGENQEEQTEE